MYRLSASHPFFLLPWEMYFRDLRYFKPSGSIELIAWVAYGDDGGCASGCCHRDALSQTKIHPKQKEHHRSDKGACPRLPVAQVGGPKSYLLSHLNPEILAKSRLTRSFAIGGTCRENVRAPASGGSPHPLLITSTSSLTYEKKKTLRQLTLKPNDHGFVLSIFILS